MDTIELCDKYSVVGTLEEIKNKMIILFRLFQVDYFVEGSLLSCREFQDLHLISTSFYLFEQNQYIHIYVLHPVGNKYYIERFHHRVMYELGIINVRLEPIKTITPDENIIYRYKSEIEYGLHPEANHKEQKTALRRFISLKQMGINETRYIFIIMKMLNGNTEIRLLAMEALNGLTDDYSMALTRR
jgi:hypothetical protein